MSMTYTWNVTAMKVMDQINEQGQVLKNAVVQTYWEKHGTDASGNEGMFAGATPFTATDVPEGEFTPFDQLTENQVLGWIQAVVVGDYAAHVDAQIQKQIDDKAITEPPLPWADPEPEPSAA